MNRPIVFVVRYYYPTENLNSEKTFHLGNVGSVVPRILQSAILSMQSGDSLEYVCSDGPFTVTIDCKFCMLTAEGEAA